MPQPSDYPFPGNVIELLAQQVPSLVPDVTTTHRRELRPTDQNGSVGVTALAWAPEDYVIGQADPGCQTYVIAIETLLRYANEEEGRMAHYKMAADLRRMLYRNSGFRILFFQLKDVSDGLTERIQKVSLRQRFVTNQIKTEWLLHSVTELMVETETV